ncbi:MAG TPA: LptF/LptG family permease [Saprospiraceae bacterium]|mgnify:CR=1 FL=1|nr:LptF/LptG family permease [Saprospiraceae bacterium]
MKVRALDKMIVKGIISPFIVTFFIALFILTMQFLWVWIDELVGKGVGVLIILELLFYLLLSFFPMAFPIAILLSSVMLMGGYAERYELSSMTSAGIPLLRIMRPLIVFAIFTAGLSFIFSNYLWPIANLKYRSRLIDIRNQKPTLSIQKGVFNHDFSGIVMRVGDKKEDDRTVSDVMLYDNQTQLDKINLLVARSGEMYTDNTDGAFVMNLRDGHQYQELVPGSSAQEAKYPFVRTNFKTFSKRFDLSQFDFNRTDESLYKTHQAMLSVRQLTHASDSIQNRISDSESELLKQLKFSLKPRFTSVIPIDEELRREAMSIQKVRTDTTSVTSSRGLNQFRRQIALQHGEDTSVVAKIQAEREANSIQSFFQMPAPSNPIIFKDLLIERLKDPVVNQGLGLLKSASNNVQLQARLYESDYLAKQKHLYEMNLKFAWAMMCVVFLFIGAPMGAIVRKGGFGYPLLVAIIFYMVFQILTTSMKKSVDSMVISGGFAPWVPVIVMAIIGSLLTRSAGLDNMINLDRFTSRLNALFLQISAWYDRKTVGLMKRK